MKNFDGIAEAHLEAQDYFFKHRADFDPVAEERLRAQFALGASPVAGLVTFAEVVFANPDMVPKEANAIAVGLADLAATHGWHGLAEGGDSGRGRMMVKALRRRGGERSKPGDDLGTKDDDPPILDHLKLNPPPEPEDENTPAATPSPAEPS